MTLLRSWIGDQKTRIGSYIHRVCKGMPYGSHVTSIFFQNTGAKHIPNERTISRKSTVSKMLALVFQVYKFLLDKAGLGSVVSVRFLGEERCVFLSKDLLKPIQVTLFGPSCIQ